MKTGKHIDTYFEGDKRRHYEIRFTECQIDCNVSFTSTDVEEDGTGIGGEHVDFEILDMDIFDHSGNKVPLSSINEEELNAIIEPLINY